MRRRGTTLVALLSPWRSPHAGPALGFLRASCRSPVYMAFGHHLQPGPPFSHPEHPPPLPRSGPGRAFGRVGSAGRGGLQTSACVKASSSI